MGTPCISCAPQPSPSRHGRSKDAEAVQGALDGDLDIPHSDKRFDGFKKDEKQLDTEIPRNYIYEDHIADYMKPIADEEPEKYQLHFSEYIKMFCLRCHHQPALGRPARCSLGVFCHS